MKTIFIILSLIAYTQARYVDNGCSGIVVRNVIHEKEVLKDNLESPYQLAMDYDTNTLFFSYSTKNDNVFESAFLNLKTNEFANIPGIVGGFANAVDSKKHVVYLGGRDGVYKFSYDSKKAQHLDSTKDNIWQLFYKDELYYSTYPDEAAFVYRNGKFQRVPELRNTKAMLLSVDNFDNIYFSNSSGLFMHKKANGEVIHIGDFNVNGFASDVNGNLFFSTPDGIFAINVNRKAVERITAIDNVYGIAIEIDGSIIYASQDSIIRLKPTEKVCPTEDATVSF